MLRAAWSTVPHSTLRTMSREACWHNPTTRFQSMTPSPHAQPMAVPVTLPRSWDDWSRAMSLACKCTKPGVGILAAQVGIARVKIDAQRRAVNEPVDSVKSFRCLAVLLVRLKPDLDAARFSEARRLLK